MRHYATPVKRTPFCGFKPAAMNLALAYASKELQPRKKH